jgi:hypothetical protein
MVAKDEKYVPIASHHGRGPVNYNTTLDYNLRAHAASKYLMRWFLDEHPRRRNPDTRAFRAKASTV